MRHAFRADGWRLLLPLLVATGFSVSGCNARGEWYDPINGYRRCVDAPRAIGYWSSGVPMRGPDDYLNLDVFLTKYPDAVSKQYGAFCRTPLHFAAMRGRDDLARLVITRGADLRALDKLGETPLHTAATYGHTKVLTVLLASGADVNAKGRERPPLHNAVSGLPGVADLETRLAATRMLLAAGADINAKERGSDRSVLISAMGSGPGGSDNTPMVKFLLEHGADVHAHDSQGTAVLGYAAGTGNARIVKLLLDRDADMNASGKDEPALGNALSTAAYGGYVEIAALLMDRGASVNWRRPPPPPIEWQGLPLAMALTVARSHDRPSMARRREVALALIAHGANVNARNETGATLLHAAAEDGDMTNLELLLSHGAAIAARDRAGFTPLHRAVQKGHVDVATRLLAVGADATAAAADGMTTLALAAGDREMEALIRRHTQH